MSTPARAKVAWTTDSATLTTSYLSPSTRGYSSISDSSASSSMSTSSSSSSPSQSPFFKPADMVYHYQGDIGFTSSSASSNSQSLAAPKDHHHHHNHHHNIQRHGHVPLIVNQSADATTAKSPSVSPLVKIAFLNSTPQTPKHHPDSLFDKHRVFSPPASSDDGDWSETMTGSMNSNDSLSLTSDLVSAHPSILLSKSLPCSEPKHGGHHMKLKLGSELNKSSGLNDSSIHRDDETEKSSSSLGDFLSPESLLNDTKRTGNSLLTVSRINSSPNYMTSTTFTSPVPRLIQQRHFKQHQLNLNKSNHQSSSSPVLSPPLKFELTNDSTGDPIRRHQSDEELLDQHGTRASQDSTRSIPDAVVTSPTAKIFVKKNKSGLKRLLLPLRRSQSTGNGNEPIDQLGTSDGQSESRDDVSLEKSDYGLADAILSPDVKKKSLKSEFKTKINLLAKRCTNLNLLAATDTRQSMPSVKLWARSLEDLLADKNGLECFRQFLNSEFSQENLDFWLACEELKKSKPHQVAGLVQKIFYEFIALKAPHEVNIDARTREITLSNMASPTFNTFDEAQKRVQALMERDSYLRFIESDFYQNLIKIKIN